MLHTVYVDELTGSNNMSCGSTRKNSCKYLSIGVNRVKESGVVKVIGNQQLRHRIVLVKSIIIAADTYKNVQRGRINSNGSVDFAFEMKCNKSLKVELKGLRFNNISVFVASCNDHYPSITIVGVTVEDISRNHPTIALKSGSISKFGSINELGSLKIYNSRFKDVTEFVLKGLNKVLLNNCTFQQLEQDRTHPVL